MQQLIKLTLFILLCTVIYPFIKVSPNGAQNTMTAINNDDLGPDNLSRTDALSQANDGDAPVTYELDSKVTPENDSAEYVAPATTGKQN